MRVYTRYSGFSQSHALTSEEKLYDETAKAVDEHLMRLLEMPASRFTVNQLLWLMGLATRTSVMPSQQHLGRQLRQLRDLLDEGLKRKEPKLED